MRQTVVLFIALAATATLHAQSSCPAEAVRGTSVHIANDCDTRLCSPASEVTLTIAPRPNYCYSPSGDCPPAYQVQACDTVRWQFHDGSPDVITVGQSSTKHLFHGLGMNYPTAIVTNTLSPVYPWESSVFGDGIYIVDDPPSRVAFSKAQYDVRENGGGVTLTVTRSGNLARTSIVTFANFTIGILPPIRLGRLQVVGGSLEFAPGETVKSFSVGVYDDATYSGDQSSPITISGSDGTLFDQGNYANATIHVIEDDYPTLLASPGLLSLRTGESATVVFSLSPALNVPLEVALSATQPNWLLLPSTITIPPGGSVTVPVGALRAGNDLIHATSSQANAAIAVDVIGRPRRRTAG